MITKKLAAVLLMAAVILGATSAFGADYKTKLTLVITDTSSGGGGDGTYIIVIPESLTMTASGWTPFEGGISIKTAEGKTFSADKKLVISADSENNWQLVLSPNKSESIGYTLTTASGGTKTVEFTYSAASIDAGVSQDLGVMVAEYTDNSEGNYEDTITFTVEVQEAGTGTVTNTLGWDGNLSALTEESTEEYATATTGMTITGTLGVNKKISIADGATVTLSGVTINGTNSESYKWAGITCVGNATIILAGTNTVKGFYEDYPGIFISQNYTLTIKGDGSLTASPFDVVGTTTSYGAGIGGTYQIACGNIEIQGGTINATGGYQAAGIGSTNRSSCGTISITGGNTTANGGEAAAGIGSGYSGSCDNITISGGTVETTGGQNAAGIGSGYNASCGTISITGGNTTANGGSRAPGIGCGDGTSASCGNITIASTVTSVTATKGSEAKDSIGAGYESTYTGTLTIEDGANVTQN